MRSGSRGKGIAISPPVFDGKIAIGTEREDTMSEECQKFATVGEKAPDFELRTNAGVAWRLSDHLGSVVALLFYPADETLVCTRQLCSVREHWNDYLDTKAKIVGVSPGSVEEHSRFAENHRLPLPLLADVDRVVTEKYCSHWLFPTFLMRSIVVVDANGIVRTRRPMLRAFRPTDRSVITEIYAARGDALHERYGRLVKQASERSQADFELESKDGPKG